MHIPLVLELLGGLLIAKAAAQNTSELNSTQELLDPLPYYYPNEDAAPQALFPMPLCQGVQLEEATIDQLQDAMEHGNLTAYDIVTCYFKRYNQVNGYVNGILQWNPDAFTIAAELDAERAAGRVRSRLHGIPFLVKDNIATKDQMDTTAGSWALVGSIVPRDAHVVAKARNAGALLLGHATLSEWADMRSTNYSEGFSARGGQARSPYNLTGNPGGSSSGSAVAVAANQAMFALGTETDGSVIDPAQRQNVCGIKPTTGLTSRAGVIPDTLHQDTIGTFGRTCRDAAYALDAIAGPDPRDNYTLAQIGNTPEGGYAQFLTDKSALKGAVFGLPWETFWSLNDPEQNSHLMELLDLIQSAGATIINGTELPNADILISRKGFDGDYGTTRGYPNESEYTVLKVDFYNNIATYLSELENTNIRSLEDIVQSNLDNLGSEGGLPGIHPAFYSGQDGLLNSLETKGVMDETYWQAVWFCKTVTAESLDAALNPFINGSHVKLDALLVPPDLGQSYQVSAQAGYPVITVPAGIGGPSAMPFGLALLGTKWGEGPLIHWASAIEDLQLSTDTPWKRTKPAWGDYMYRKLPVIRP
ncbi:hypothetical protein A1O1_07907 [Capronia coronata CBS 617.96]|uniref:Amidase domain-containing protein n=1 Tax=Capronia coronata CBS 617.96 TaxID=1182541 RepID=W9XMW0_9EURO|nr:uncharacterized protein A1O1_07907 [Capronia coronata CBS 617.96]EXJ81842.1 hypothetical protein A1O1_07907 [Capronia coronata CBS 617.96]